MLKLSNRLKALTEYISAGATVADIGTDHGFLPVYLAQTGLARVIIASDISTGSLNAALLTAGRFGVTDKIKFIVTPGLDGISQTDADTIVIAGMGGETILDILSNAPWTGCSGVKLILQPQSKIDVLFRFLYDNEYKVRETKSVKDKGRYYTVALLGS